MAAEVQPEDLQMAANQVISQLLNDNIALRATVEAQARKIDAQDEALSAAEKELSQLQKDESPNGKVEELEVAK